MNACHSISPQSVCTLCTTKYNTMHNIYIYTWKPNTILYIYIHLYLLVYIHIYSSLSIVQSSQHRWFMVTCALFPCILYKYFPQHHHYHMSGWLTGSSMKIMYSRDLCTTDSTENVHGNELEMSAWLQLTQHTRLHQSIVGVSEPITTWPLVGLILGLRPANERRRYLVTTSLIGKAQA